MDDEKKKFTIPEASVVDFVTEDIITLSTYETNGFLSDGDREDWEEE